MPKFKQQRPLLLASESPRRIEILRNAGISFKVMTSPYTEPELNLAPTELAKMHALGKIISLLKQDIHQDHVFIGVDTIVSCDDRILLKPKDFKDAKAMLQLQQGKTVEVISGLAVIDPKFAREKVIAVSTTVHMSELSQAEIDWYLETGEWEGKSGGFAIQGLASRFFTGIDGDILNVIGLPLNTLYQILKSWQIFA